MRAVMLAAGVGARLGEGDDAPPKALLRFGGQTLLARHIALLRHAGVEALHVTARPCTNPRCFLRVLSHSEEGAR